MVRKAKKSVSSKIENSKKDTLISYRKNIKDMTVLIKKYSLSLDDNLLSVKMSLMNTVKELEDMMRERRE